MDKIFQNYTHGQGTGMGSPRGYGHGGDNCTHEHMDPEFFGIGSGSGELNGEKNGLGSGFSDGRGRDDYKGHG